MATVQPERGEDFNEVKRTKIVDVLNRIIQQK
ncbi:hypothetical protein MPL3356_400067 [Mesorhizobium plurifarium]|uniref:Uncharacterized protein n=1 Tax=Mesorhizobium plurifarium TaxID=69974 RepID=A0A090EAF0_MESPL|nr:hypothetical protein MPL3356_400067 [Mesorhizobium plurifarium]